LTNEGLTNLQNLVYLYLDLKQNNIGGDGIITFSSQGLGMLKNLKRFYINLSENHISEKGFESFAFGI